MYLQVIRHSFTFWAVALALLLPGCSSEPSGPQEKRLVFLMNGNSPFWTAVGKGIEAANEEFKVDAVLEQNNGTPEGQINKLKQYATQTDIAAIAISATDAANPAIAQEMRNLRKNGIHVITVDSDVDSELYGDARFAFIGTDNLQAGRELGKAMKNLRPEGGEYVTFVGRTTAQNAIERVQGVKEGAGKQFTRLDNMGDSNDLSKARQNVRDAISNHPNLNALVGIWSYNAPAIVDVIKGKDREKYTVAVFDAEPVAIDEMANGNIDAMLVQNPFQMGYQGVRLMNALVKDDQVTIQEMLPNHGEEGGDIYETGLKMVVPEDSPLNAEMFGETTEFLKLDEFRKWMQKYDLEGS